MGRDGAIQRTRFQRKLGHKLYADECSVAVEIVESKPEKSKGARGQKHSAELSQMTCQATKEGLADFSERNNVREHVRDNGIHSNHSKKKSPATVTEHINEPIKEGQQHQA